MARYLGIDVGGTNTKAALVDDEGRILATGEVPTRPDGTIGAVLAAIEAAVPDAVTSVDAVGLALPGIVDDASG